MTKNITVERIDPLSPSSNPDVTFWRVSGPRVRGVVTALIGYPDGKGPQMYLSLDWTATDERGHTVYRDANPDAFEVQSTHAVRLDPLRVNGIPYSGTEYFSVPDGRWTYGGYTHGVTDAGQKVVNEVGRLIAAELGTPENIKAAELRSLARDRDRAREALDKAQTAYDAAQAAYDQAASETP